MDGPPPRLFQFWHSGTPPDEVARLVEGWAADPRLRHSLFDAPAAEAFIAGRLGERQRAAFRRCAVPAMQADFFRYCALLAEGGAYLDADARRLGSLADLLAGAGPRGLLVGRTRAAGPSPGVIVMNGFLFARAPGDPLFERAVAVATANIERQVSQNVWEVTGPQVLTRLWHDPATHALFDGFRLRAYRDLQSTFKFVDQMAYKGAEEDWRVNLYFPDLGRSIFRDP